MVATTAAPLSLGADDKPDDERDQNHQHVSVWVSRAPIPRTIEPVNRGGVNPIFMKPAPKVRLTSPLFSHFPRASVTQKSATTRVLCMHDDTHILEASGRPRTNRFSHLLTQCDS